MREIMKDEFAGGHGFSRSISHRVTGWEAAQELTDRLTVVAAQEKFTAGWISVGTPSTLSLLISKSNWRRGPRANRAGVSSVPLHTTAEVSSDRSIFGEICTSRVQLSWWNGLENKRSLLLRCYIMKTGHLSWCTQVTSSSRTLYWS